MEKVKHGNRTVTGRSRIVDQTWSQEAINALLNARIEHKSMFRTIASHLNDLAELTDNNLGRSRRFTDLDCSRKMRSLFPQSNDAAAAVKYLTRLKRDWPGMHLHVIVESDASGGVPSEIHVTWPVCTVLPYYHILITYPCYFPVVGRSCPVDPWGSCVLRRNI